MNLGDLRKQFDGAAQALQDLRRRAATAQPADLDELAAAIPPAAAKVDALRAALGQAEAELAEREAEKAARERAAAQAKAQAEVKARCADLTRRWSVLGARLSAIDAELPQLWQEYRELGRAALALASESRAAGLAETLHPDTSAATDVMGRICSGASAIKDWRRK